MSTETFEDVVCERTTDKACLVVFNRDQPKRRRAVWVPRSAIHDDSEVYDANDGAGPGKFVVASWFADKEGLG